MDFESVLVKLDDVPLDRLRDADDAPALVHALRRVVAVAAGNRDGDVARFNNAI